ncbi:hypothetical protein LZZ85_28265 [Terrimonas sp. NA20]|uniref:Uncharacterized protein n=1 Tax=Terrimonas ginsenosidimutans TaxID=2908004 RepID=A0ABS9L140_9BACT|nr:hypothetical protein [Terrimonas ginsenosidimutans]MCG2618223.1 hypothetical protein [Terrimonas ginsenosidimutans]
MEKLKEYAEYHGYYDGFYLQKVKWGKNLISDSEWNLVKNLSQDIYLVQKNLASKEFADRVNQKLNESCDNQDTIEYLKRIAGKGW